MSPRPLTILDANPALCDAGDYYMNGQRVGLSSEAAVARIEGMLLAANSLNDLASSFGINTPHLPGDMLLCKLNLVKMKKPRRNPAYRKPQ